MSENPLTIPSIWSKSDSEPQKPATNPYLIAAVATTHRRAPKTSTTTGPQSATSLTVDVLGTAVVLSDLIDWIARFGHVEKVDTEGARQPRDKPLVDALSYSG